MDESNKAHPLDISSLWQLKIAIYNKLDWFNYKNSIIKQYRKLLYMDGVDLTFEEEALRLIAKIANSTKTGARGLRSILENVLTNIMFDYAGDKENKKININIDYVENSLKEKYDLVEIKKKAA